VQMDELVFRFIIVMYYVKKILTGLQRFPRLLERGATVVEAVILPDVETLPVLALIIDNAPRRRRYDASSNASVRHLRHSSSTTRRLAMRMTRSRRTRLALKLVVTEGLKLRLPATS
jgi:hypothetical protein